MSFVREGFKLEQAKVRQVTYLLAERGLKA